MMDVDVIAEVMAETIKEQLAPLKERLDKLERAAKAAKAKPK